MSEVRGAIRLWNTRTLLAVGGAHFAVLLMLWIPGMFRTPPANSMRVRLTAASEAPPALSHADRRAVSNDSQPAEVNPSAGGRTTEAWNPRSVEDIRNHARLRPVPSNAADSRPSRSKPDLSDLRRELRRRTQVAFTSSSAPVGTWSSSRYVTAVRSQLYRLWKEPSGTAGQGGKVHIRVDGVGRVLEARLLQADTQQLREGLAQLVQSLHSLPPPSEFGLEKPVLSFIVQFRLEE